MTMSYIFLLLMFKYERKPFNANILYFYNESIYKTQPKYVLCRVGDSTKTWCPPRDIGLAF